MGIFNVNRKEHNANTHPQKGVKIKGEGKMSREKLKVAKSNIPYYRECFSTAAGQKVLGDILLQSGYFDIDLEAPEEIAMANFGKYIMQSIGIHYEPSNVGSYVNSLFNLPWRTDDKKEN